MSVTLADVVSANRYLTEAETRVNAEYVARSLRSEGWSVNAIAATLANMEAESGINPGIYESLDDSSATNGFGLVQWTPNTKYKTWADANNFEYGNINGQIKRIIYELENDIQWIETDTYPYTFEEYSKSQYDPGTLAYMFMYNYERPATLDQPERKENAYTWLEFLEGLDFSDSGSGDGGGEDQKKNKRMSRVLFWYGGIR